MKKIYRQSTFARRVVAYYLLCSLLAVAWLSVGTLATARRVLMDRATSACLSRLGQLGAAIEMEYLRNEGEGVEQLVGQARAEGRLAYCTLVGVDGRYLAHTTRPLVGAPAAEPSGTRLRWGSVDGVRYQDDLRGTINEYRASLAVDGKPLGSLRLGVVEPGMLSVFSEVAESAPVLVLAPLAIVVAGALVLVRQVRPVAEIDCQLQSIAATPFGQRASLEEVASEGPAATGWNRLFTEWSQGATHAEEEDLEAKLVDALKKRRGGQSMEVLQALHEGIAVTDVEGRIEFANAAVASLLDWSADGKAPEGSLAALLASSTKGYERVLDAAIATPVVAEVEAADENQERVLRVERQPLGAGEGRAVWSIRDVTQQKLAEKSRDQFIDAATHELRTPLANIKAYAETLATCQVNDPEQQKEFYNTINAEATRLARFVDDLLDISSMEVGSLTIRRQNVDVERLLREAAAKIKPVAEKKSQAFELVLPPKLGEMHLDKDKVSALLVNLLGNASKYTPEGGKVRLKAELNESALAITVADTGVGIAPDELPKVFDKFFRSEDPRVRDETGTGLGLSLAREIARLHGGDITAASRVGEGSLFTISLPRTERDSQ
ncbi:MAG: ATP-binding protein [Planctomycetota bacterium]